MKKQTIKNSVTLSGVGLHTGKTINVTLNPADNGGIKFKRTDLEPNVLITADPNSVGKTNRNTTLTKGDTTISTVEHLMAALSGLGIDNVLIEVDGPEIPILDGSSIKFVEAINTAGIEELEDDRSVFVIKEPISIKNEETGAEIIGLPSDKFELHVIIDFPGAQVSEQTAGIHNLDEFEQEIASCRTFVFTNELEILLERNLIKGGDLSNALVIAEKGLTQENLDALTDKFDLGKKTIQENGLINTSGLRYKNELARHKLLDVIGDLALLGRPIQGKIIAIKPGHKINTDFAALLKKKVLQNRKLKGKPNYDANIPPLYDLERIKSTLPHRYPFLMLDKIIEISDSHIVGVKNISGNEALFQGHFPGNPIFPGVLQMEALAQCGGILALSFVEEPHLWDTYFLKMNDVKFKAMVVPGDTMLLKMELLSPIRRGIVHMQGTAYVGNKIVSEGELTAQIVKRQQ